MSERQLNTMEQSSENDLFQDASSVQEIRAIVDKMAKRQENFVLSTGDIITATDMLQNISRTVALIRNEFPDPRVRPPQTENIERILANNGITRDKGLRSALLKALSSDFDVIEINTVNNLQK